MRAILYVGHGTRRQQGVIEATTFLQQTMPYIKEPIQEIAFLELTPPSIAQGIATCITKGATTIIVVPLLLLKAVHAKIDIPQEIMLAKAHYPQVRFIQAQPLGIHPLLINTLYERITEQHIQIQPDAHVLLVGRGSSDNNVITSMHTISEQLKKHYHFASVDVCFLYGNGPSFNTMLKKLRNTKKQTFIIPYLLFAGLLSAHIAKEITTLRCDTSLVTLCQSLGYNEKVRAVLIERVHDSLLQIEEVGSL